MNVSLENIILLAAGIGAIGYLLRTARAILVKVEKINAMIEERDKQDGDG